MAPNRRQILTTAGTVGVLAAGYALFSAAPRSRPSAALTAPSTLTEPATPSAPSVPGTPASLSTPGTPAAPSTPGTANRAEVVARYRDTVPTRWGTDVPGVLDRLPGERGQIALTFDACGGPGGDGYDRALIDLLRERNVPATLFLNSRWIDANPVVSRRLAAEPLFEIADHGTRHRPLSVTGRSAYGIAGTQDAGEVVAELTANRDRLADLLGAPPRFFRPGTAYCDDVAVRIAAELGQRVVGFTVNGDAGATYSAAEIAKKVGAARPGSIVIAHMNHPEGDTAVGFAAALPGLLAAGHGFTRLSDAFR